MRSGLNETLYNVWEHVHLLLTWTRKSGKSFFTLKVSTNKVKVDKIHLDLAVRFKQNTNNDCWCNWRTVWLVALCDKRKKRVSIPSWAHLIGLSASRRGNITAMLEETFCGAFHDSKLKYGKIKALKGAKFQNCSQASFLTNNSNKTLNCVFSFVQLIFLCNCSSVFFSFKIKFMFAKLTWSAKKVKI